MADTIQWQTEYNSKHCTMADTTTADTIQRQTLCNGKHCNGRHCTMANTVQWQTLYNGRHCTMADTLQGQTQANRDNSPIGLRIVINPFWYCKPFILNSAASILKLGLLCIYVYLPGGFMIKWNLNVPSLESWVFPLGSTSHSLVKSPVTLYKPRPTPLNYL